MPLEGMLTSVGACLGDEEQRRRTLAIGQNRGKNDRLRFSSVDFAGELIVRDAAEVGNALTQGIGQAKAFGCGLLLVRRLG